MAETPIIRSTEVGTLTAVHRVTPSLLLGEGGALTVFGFPTPFVESSQVGTISATNFLAGQIQVSELSVVTLAMGRIEDPTLKAFTFELDGHDFYVLHLGDGGTLVYDVYSEQWVAWESRFLEHWRAKTGINWSGGQPLAYDYGSDIIVGDDVHNVLYFLDPDMPYDDPPTDFDPDRRDYFERVVQGQVPIRGREVIPTFAVWITTDMGQPAYEGAGVTLYTSDDAGHSYDDHGLVKVTSGEFSPELAWYSLGQISAPGRLFKFVDDGAVVRIDSFEMNDRS